MESQIIDWPNKIPRQKLLDSLESLIFSYGGVRLIDCSLQDRQVRLYELDEEGTVSVLCLMKQDASLMPIYPEGLEALANEDMSRNSSYAAAVIYTGFREQSIELNQLIGEVRVLAMNYRIRNV